MTVNAWIKKHTKRLDGRLIAVSGSTGGLGGALCRHLAALGASLILLDRNPAKAQALSEDLRAEYPALSVRHIPMDLTDLSTVFHAADELSSLPLDFLILNAGAYSVPRFTCESGFDNVFQINFLAPYLLADRLLPHLRERGGKVVAVGSIAHRYSQTDPSDPDFSARRKASLVYGNAKRHLMATLPALANSPNEIALTHPGITFTNITAHYPPLIFALIKHPMKVIFMSPKRASLSILAGLFTSCKEDEWIGPRFFDVWGLPRKKVLRSIPPAERARLRREAERMRGCGDARGCDRMRFVEPS